MAGSLAGATAQTIIYPMEVRRRGSRHRVGSPTLTSSLRGVLSIEVTALPLRDADRGSLEQYCLMCNLSGCHNL